jgi:hypothetical protein
MGDDVVCEPLELVLEWLELEHEQFDSGVVESLDPFDHLLVAADQAGKGAAVGPDAFGSRQHLVHLGFGSVPPEISGRLGVGQ